MAKDRFEEMNGILDQCVNGVKVRVADYTKAQKRIAADKSPAGFATLLPTQIEAMAKGVIAEHTTALQQAAVASVVA